MKKKDRERADLIRLAARIAELIEIAKGERPNMFRLAPTIAEWIRSAESLRRRYEAQCSYPAADTDKYRNATDRKEAKLIESVEAAGLHGYLQTDPRGATLYVDSKPLYETTYTRGVCVCVG